MEQQHLLPEETEPVTASEVRALVERFGERQAMAQGQPTVQDVAEALQVSPATVSKMLLELRQSKDQDEIKRRLDSLEKENAELRERTVIASQLHTPFPNASVRVPFLAAMMVSIIATAALFGPSAHVWPKQFAAIVLLFVPLFLLGRWLRLGTRNR